MVHLTRKEAGIVKDSIEAWQQEKIINSVEAERLKSAISIIPFNWKKLAKYSFWVAIITFIISIGSLISDIDIQRIFAYLFNAPASYKCISLTILSCLIFWLGKYRQKKRPSQFYQNEAILFIGVLVTASAVYQLGRAIDTGSGHFSLLILLSCILYAVLGYWFKSKLIWFFSILSLGAWFGAETGYISGWGAYYLGMNFPMRFVLFGGVLTALAYHMHRIPQLALFENVTLVMGLLYLFIALWILSIFGDYGDMSVWRNVKQIELMHWSLLFAIGAIIALYHGLKTDNSITKGFGLTFLFINLYTRFFELFWNQLYKGVFFALLAISFWWLGSKAEKIWHHEKVLKGKSENNK